MVVDVSVGLYRLGAASPPHTPPVGLHDIVESAGPHVCIWGGQKLRPAADVIKDQLYELLYMVLLCRASRFIDGSLHKDPN